MIKPIFNADIKKELESIGFDKTYINKAVEKYQYINLKIYALSLPQANILKQTALSVGADCAVHRELITAKVEKTDCILGGSFSQLHKIAQKLKHQPFSLAKLAEEIEGNLVLPTWNEPKIVGILNLTKNSFSDGGEFYDFDKAIKHLNDMLEEGADIVDIGAESTKPFSEAVVDDEQLEKLLPVLDYIKQNNIKTPISIDTRSARVALECIQKGASIINDVSGLGFDPEMVHIIAKNGVKVIIQHTKGTPEDMQVLPSYENLMDEIFTDLKKRIEFALENGVDKKNIIVDPGIGFGKTREHNFEILNRIEELKFLGCPVMLGLSRKSLLGMDNATNEEKDVFTVALNTLALNNCVDFIRVHNVNFHKQLAKFFLAVLNNYYENTFNNKSNTHFTPQA